MKLFPRTNCWSFFPWQFVDVCGSVCAQRALFWKTYSEIIVLMRLTSWCIVNQARLNSMTFDRRPQQTLICLYSTLFRLQIFFFLRKVFGKLLLNAAHSIFQTLLTKFRIKQTDIASSDSVALRCICSEVGTLPHATWFHDIYFKWVFLRKKCRSRKIFAEK